MKQFITVFMYASVVWTFIFLQVVLFPLAIILPSVYNWIVRHAADLGNWHIEQLKNLNKNG